MVVIGEALQAWGLWRVERGAVGQEAGNVAWALGGERWEGSGPGRGWLCLVQAGSFRAGVWEEACSAADRPAGGMARPLPEGAGVWGGDRDPDLDSTQVNCL